ncbi:hypothetical protein LTR86_011080 [Recurvomyces mirabilis]|nr:hypothetical protein LTR86_011080 [Recurvomyces mirabilis]
MDNSTSSYIYLSFPNPSNWVPAKLYDPPSIETFYKPYESYNALEWALYVLAECQSLNGGSCVSYSELTTGAYMTENATRIWWGIVYDASTILTLENFRRDDSENDMVGDTKVAVVKVPQASASTATATSSVNAEVGTATSTTSETIPATTTGEPTSSNVGSTASSSAVAAGSGALRRNKLSCLSLGILIPAITLWR